MNHCSILRHQPSLCLDSLVVVLSVLGEHGTALVPHVVYRSTPHGSWVTARQRYHTTCMIPHTEWSISVVVTVFSTDLYHNNTYHLSFVSFRHKPSRDLRKRIQLCMHIYPWSMSGPPILLNKHYLDKLNFSMKARSDISTPRGTNPKLERFHIWI